MLKTHFSDLSFVQLLKSRLCKDRVEVSLTNYKNIPILFYSGRCYRRLRHNEPVNPLGDKQHSIQLLDIPATPDRKRGLDYTLEKRLSQYNQAVRESLQLSPLIKITE